MQANYVFRVTVQLDPSGAHLDPHRFETVCRLPAATPGTDGWLFFQYNLWRGDIADAEHMQSLLTEKLGVEVVDASFSELETDAAYRAALENEIETDLSRFNADSVDAVVHQHLGSSIHVRDAEAIPDT
ncbi:LWR-salt protein [Halonotius sp. GCM10025705]|uniref:LWR-salt protein n=1 Tax=Halonotius sp. GCM10025705 TaxID=3252678 RepID=UPI0036068159